MSTGINKIPLGALTIRLYGAKSGDYQLVNEWWNHHRQEDLPETILPPNGVIVESDGNPACAVWLHLSLGIGVAFLENPVTRPGLTQREAVKCFAVAMGGLREIAKVHDYGLFIAHAEPGIARVLQRAYGFKMASTAQKVTMIKEVD